ncbi:hypothetical protein [Streptomyces silaceus]|nr:hypothetical protein [Streptomyces silaceus]
MGFVLILAAVAFAGGMLFSTYSSSRWSEGELRDAAEVEDGTC